MNNIENFAVYIRYALNIKLKPKEDHASQEYLENDAFSGIIRLAKNMSFEELGNVITYFEEYNQYFYEMIVKTESKVNVQMSNIESGKLMRLIFSQEIKVAKEVIEKYKIIISFFNQIISELKVILEEKSQNIVK